MHEIGSRMWTNWYDKDGNYKGYTNRIDFYDFSFQQMTKKNFVIHPGDRFNIHCVYNSLDRENYTNFDLGSEDEMCIEFIAYYPSKK